MTEPILDVQQAGFFYQSQHWLFRQCSLQVRRGEVWAVLGLNGCGKTTLFACILGARRLREGHIHAAGPPGYVPQAHRLAFGYTVLDVVLMGRARHVPVFASPSRHDEAMALRALDNVGVAALADREMHSLSGGERQLVLIARALASESELILFDEPAASLDLGNQGVVLSLLRQLAEQGHGVVFTTHHPDHAKFIADGALLMSGGGECITGSMPETLSDERLTSLYGVTVRTISFEHEGLLRQTVVPVFG